MFTLQNGRGKTLKVLAMTTLLTGLAAGCAKVPTSSYCLIDTPLFFSAQETVDFLKENDIELLREIVAQNETYERVCG